MYSTWTDNDQINDSNQRKFDSGLKKMNNGNRIQVVSKVAPSADRNLIQFKYNNPNESGQFFNQTLNQRSGGLVIRKAHTLAEEYSDKNERDKNILKLMQQQLQLAKKNYEQKIKIQLKQSSMDSQLTKLKIVIQNNNQQIAAKDQQIQQLKLQINRINLPKPADTHKNNNLLGQKLNDVQNQFVNMMQNHHKLGYKISQIGVKVEFVQKGLLSILACRLTKTQARINEFVEHFNKKLSLIQMNLLSKLKKETSNSSTNLKNLVPQNNMQIVIQKLDTLRQQVQMFKNKQFRYENSNILLLKKQMNEIKNNVNQLEKRFSQVKNNILRSSKASSRKNYDSSKRNNSVNLSSYFDDYQQVCEEVDSLGQDQFFHPLQQSTRRYTHKQQNYSQTRHQSKPTIHNDSFQNFTGDQEEEENSNQKRLINALKSGGYRLPLHIEIDLSGFIRKKSDQKYLFDNFKKGFMLSALQLNRCKEKGWIIW